MRGIVRNFSGETEEDDKTRNVVTRLTVHHNRGLEHHRYISLPDNCDLAKKQLCIIVWWADRARQASLTDHWQKTRNG
jgi:hypothetical protein